MFNFLSSSFSCFGTAPRAPNIIGVIWYLNPRYCCCSSDTSGMYLSFSLFWRLVTLKSSGTPTSTIVHVAYCACFLSQMTMSGRLCSILLVVVMILFHQISFDGVLITGGRRSILWGCSSLMVSLYIILATWSCLALV